MGRQSGNIYRTTISIPIDLKRRMDAAGRGVNWSAVAARAFEVELAEIASKKKEKTMNDVVQRLRASKYRGNNERFKAGEKVGQKWAKEDADADELERLDERDFSQVFDSEKSWSMAWLRLYKILHPEHSKEPDRADDFWKKQLGRYHDSVTMDQMFMKGFIKGALDVWHEVKEKL
jgi:hypothetical protein